MISFRYSVDDVIKAQRLYYQRTDFAWQIFNTLLFLAGVFLYFQHPANSFGLAHFMMVYGSLSLVFQYTDSRYTRPKRAREYLKERRYGQENKLESLTIAISWNEEYLRLQVKDQKKEFSWRDFSKYLENEHIFLLFIASKKGDTIDIPKRCFENKEQMEEFSDHVSLIKKSARLPMMGA